MRLKVLSTGSSGNCYLLQDEGRTLILDAGFPIRMIMEGIDNPSSIVGCLVTHEHMDHAKAMCDLAKRGIRVYASRGTWRAVTENPIWSGISVMPGCSFSVGGFTVKPFRTEHDAAEPLGFLIRNDMTGEVILYATDTYYLRHTFPGVHYWLIECNYCDDMVDQMLFDGELNLELRNRLKKSHLSLDRLKEALSSNDLSITRNIVLCHLSDVRSDEERMVREVEALTGIPTVAADRGMVIPLELAPF